MAMKQPKVIETLAFCDLLTNETKVELLNNVEMDICTGVYVNNDTVLDFTVD